MNTTERRKQIDQFLSALGEEQIEVGLFNPISKLLLSRPPFPASDFEKYRGWLASQNVKGEGVFIRPAPAEIGALVLVDDLTETTLAKIRPLLSPCAIVETSPGNFQAWVKFDTAVDQNFRTRLAKHLAQKFQADPGAASWRQFGRCPGFNNTKAEYRKPNGYFPVANLVYYSAVVHPLPGLPPAQSKPDRSLQRQQPAIKVQQADQGLDLASLDYSLRYCDFTEHLKVENQSSRDFGVACEAFKLGLAVAQVREILEQSPSLIDRKKDPQGYVDLTLEAAYRSVVLDQGYDLLIVPPKPARKIFLSSQKPQSGFGQGEN